jgi:Ca2+/Na+ antiporter
MGAFLFTLGGYTLPFMTFSALYFIAYPYIWMSLSRSKSQIENEEGAEIDEENKKEDVELKALLSKPRFVFGLLAQMMMMMSIQFLAPNLAIHL